MSEKEWVRTNEIRFVEKTIMTPAGSDDKHQFFKSEWKKILQQKFELWPSDSKMTRMIANQEPLDVEWRDVPIVSE